MDADACTESESELESEWLYCPSENYTWQNKKENKRKESYYWAGDKSCGLILCSFFMGDWMNK